MKYTIGKNIGDKGGCGDVYECESELGQIYAVKILKEDADVEIVLRFQKEVRLTKRLNHPNIIKIISYNVDKERKYYIMPRYNCSLANIIPELYNDYNRQFKILNEILNGLIYLHSQGVLHRDLKPQNVLYNTDTDIVINDLGFSRQVSSDSERLTRFGEVFGTSRYISPEQNRNSENVDERTDIYALGKIIEDIVTNNNEYPIPNEQFEYIINKCTKSNKEKRITSVDEVKNIINGIYMQLLKINSNNEVDSLIMDLQLGELDDAAIVQLALQLISLNDGDKVEDYFTYLRKKEYQKLEEDNLDITQDLVRILKKYYTSQMWGFGYTDTIGSLCQKFYKWSEDATIKAYFLYSIMDVGVDHNRYYVMGIAKDLVLSLENPVEVHELVGLLENKHISFQSLGVNKNELPEALKKYY